VWFNWGSAIVLADHTRFSWANPTAGSLRHCLTSKTRHAPNTRRCPAPGPKTARELNPIDGSDLFWEIVSYDRITGAERGLLVGSVQVHTEYLLFLVSMCCVA
jgi:hypothetical protein